MTRAKGNLEELVGNCNGSFAAARAGRNDFLERGLYAEQLERFYALYVVS